jgi:hypothetical protein
MIGLKRLLIVIRASLVQEIFSPRVGVCELGIMAGVDCRTPVVFCNALSAQIVS